MALNDRRSFLKMTALAGAFSTNSLFRQAHAAELEAASNAVNHLGASAVAQNEDYWSVIQRGYSVSTQIINLNNGGVSPAPVVVQQAVERYNQMTNEGPSYYMWQILDQGREPLRQKLANLGGTSPDEIAINRNSTEALNTLIYGIPLKAGDEVVGSKQDYPHMMYAYRQRAERDGIIYKQIDFNFPIEDVDTIVKAYEQADDAAHEARSHHPHGQLGRTAHACAADRRHGARARQPRSSSTERTPSASSTSRFPTSTATTSAPACTSSSPPPLAQA